MPTAVDNVSVEDEGIFGWRKDAWLKLGYSEAWADFLSRTKIDVHHAGRMLSQGASGNQAVSILAGTSPLGDDPGFDWDAYHALLALDR